MAWYNPANLISRGIHYLGGLADESQSTKQQRAALEGQAAAAGGFAGQAQSNYGALTPELQAQRAALQRIANGQDSLSAEQLRQGNQRIVAQQRGMAAGASPGNAVAAARQASINTMRAQSGLAGQQAIAGIQERQGAQQALAQMLMQQRQQELQAALQARQTAIGGYGAYKPEGSWLDKWGGAIQGGAAVGAKAFSDRRLKEDVAELGDDEARKVLAGLKGYAFKYKDERHGHGRQLGAMAQDLEAAGLGHAVEDTPSGKAVHGAKLALGNTALIASLHRRVAELEGKGKK